MASRAATDYHWGMKTIEMVLRSHPRADPERVTAYAETIRALMTCSEICTACADACLGEPEQLEHLRRCISTDLDCADVCAAAARLLTRQTEMSNEVLQAQLHAAVLACQRCADACEMHGSDHDHCQICAEACRYCQERCTFLLNEIAAATVAAEESGVDTRPLTR